MKNDYGHSNGHSFYISGDTLKIIHKLNRAFELLIDKHPDIILGAITAWSAKLFNASFNLTPEESFFKEIIEDVCAEYIEHSERKDIEDD